MRTKGYTHPLSVRHIQTDVCNKYSKIKEARLIDMLTPKGIIYAHIYQCTLTVMLISYFALLELPDSQLLWTLIIKLCLYLF